MAMTMVGTQAPQKLFTDIPASNANIPGMVTPNITAAMPSYADLEGILNTQNRQKEISANAWARAAINAARASGKRWLESGTLFAGNGESNVWDGVPAECAWRGKSVDDVGPT